MITRAGVGGSGASCTVKVRTVWSITMVWSVLWPGRREGAPPGTMSLAGRRVLAPSQTGQALYLVAGTARPARHESQAHPFSSWKLNSACREQASFCKLPSSLLGTWVTKRAPLPGPRQANRWFSPSVRSRSDSASRKGFATPLRFRLDPELTKLRTVGRRKAGSAGWLATSQGPVQQAHGAASRTCTPQPQTGLRLGVTRCLSHQASPALLPFVRAFCARQSVCLWWDDDGVCHRIQQGDGSEQGDDLRSTRLVAVFPLNDLYIVL